MRTFSFIAAPASRTKTLVNMDSLLINARCDSKGAPVIFGFSSADAADIFGRVFDGLGRTVAIRNTSFSRGGKGIQLSPSRNDFHVSGMVLYESVAGQVVQVSFAADDATTLGKRRVCTVFGTAIAS